MPQGAGFSHPRLFVPVWASDSGNPLWHESHKLEPETQQELMGWGAATTACLVTPGAAGWTSGLSLSAEAAPSQYVSNKTETRQRREPAQPPLITEACATLKRPGRVKVSSKVLVWDLGEDVPKSALIYKSGPPCMPP